VVVVVAVVVVVGWRSRNVVFADRAN